MTAGGARAAASGAAQALTPAAAGTDPDRGRPDRPPGQVRVLLVEDDDGDAFLVAELLAEAGGMADDLVLTRARRITEAQAALDTQDVDCVLLDLGLPDADGLSGLTRVLSGRPTLAAVVLTGLGGEQRGLQAVAAGAQDYLVKGQVDGDILHRSVRYAVERSRAEASSRQLAEAALMAAENARLERGLLPTPLLRKESVTIDVRYRPGRRRALLGGDFYDVVTGPDGRVRLLVGDVSGHGPDEAALGVALRVAWRTLVLAGMPDDGVLPTLERVLVSERDSVERFATAAMVVLATDYRTAVVRMAGHPPPVVGDAAGSVLLGGLDPGPALGVVEDWSWATSEVTLPQRWWLLLYTDGLVEARTPDGGRLDDDGLLRILAGSEPPDLDALIDRVEALNGGPLTDDVAALLVSLATPPTGPASQ